MKVILNQQITDLMADEGLENEIEVEGYHLYQSYGCVLDSPSGIHSVSNCSLLPSLRR